MTRPDNWRDEWDRRYSEETQRWREPDPSLVSLYEDFLKPAFPKGGRALDVAGGMGRHGLWLAERGWQVTVWDYSTVALRKMAEIAQEKRVSVSAANVDILSADFGREGFDLIMVFYFLERAVMPKLVSALRPGGFLLYKTFTIEQLGFEKGPRDEDYLLQPNELLRTFLGLHVVHYREVVTDGGKAELLARKI